MKCCRSWLERCCRSTLRLDTQHKMFSHIHGSRYSNTICINTARDCGYLFLCGFQYCVFVCAKDDAIMENNMKMEVTGKLKTHFNTAPKHSTTTAGVSVIMVSTWNETWFVTYFWRVFFFQSCNCNEITFQRSPKSKSAILMSWCGFSCKWPGACSGMNMSGPFPSIYCVIVNVWPKYTRLRS